LKKLFYLTLAHYLRHSPIAKGRHRLLSLARPIGREIGHSVGWRRIRTRHDFLMDLNLKDWIPQDIFLLGEFEPATTTVVKILLERGDRVVDVGANIGYFSLLFSQCVGEQGQVHSFEPVPQLASMLQSNAALNRFSQITLNRVALSDHEGQAHFYVGPDDNSGLSSLRQPRSSSASLDVELKKFDGIFSPDENIALIKIDVEGAELAVVRGMDAYLRARHPNILLEVTKQFLEEMGDSEQGLLTHLQDLGYHCYVIGEARIELLQSRTQALPEQWNALFSTEKIFGDASALS
jgi:FkbM family methyltransferase